MALRVRETRAAAEQSKIVFFDAGAHYLNELTAMFAELSKRKPLALVVTAEPFTMEHRSRILEFMTGNAIPAMYEDSRFVEAGGLMSYGHNLADVPAFGELCRQDPQGRQRRPAGRAAHQIRFGHQPEDRQGGG